MASSNFPWSDKATPRPWCALAKFESIGLDLREELSGIATAVASALRSASEFDRKLDEVKSEIQAMRIHSVAVHQDIQNIYSMLSRYDTRLDRIERRLELSEIPA